MLDRDMKAAVKSVLGTSASIGILVENENPNDLMQAVDEGKFDSEINEEKTETSDEKRQKLKSHFEAVKSEQDAKAAAAAKEAEEAEAKKAEEAEAETGEEAEPTETTPAEAEPTETTPTEEKK